MDNLIKILLKKLDEIDNRLKKLEEKTIIPSTEQKSKPSSLKTTDKPQRDPLFSQAVSIIDNYEEISALELAKILKIDQKRAEVILDQLEEAGFGICYFKEV